MKSDLTWTDRRTSSYKDFVKEMKSTSSENFFRDGERIFTEKEMKFMKILEHKNAKNKLTIPHSEQVKLAKGLIGEKQYEIHSKELTELIYEKTPTLQEDNLHLKTTIEGYSKEELIDQPVDELEHLLSLIKEELKIQKKNDDFSRMSLLDSEIKELETVIHYNKSINNNQNPKIMEPQKDFDQVQYLKDQMKYLGFGEDEKLHKDLEKGINSKKQQFEVKTASDKALPGNQVTFTLKFNKTEKGGVFFNSYNAVLSNEKNENISHNFPVSRESTFTAKEAVNLLEGRTVKIEFQNPKTEQMEPAFVKLNFNEPKTEKGNYNFQNFYMNYGVDTARIVEKSNLIFDKPEYKTNTIRSLEKGNVVKVKFEQGHKVIEGKAALNPQYKNLNLYDLEMNRVNTNKPLEGLENDNKHEKNNVKEQSIRR